MCKLWSVLHTVTFNVPPAVRRGRVELRAGGFGRGRCLAVLTACSVFWGGGGVIFG